MIKLIALYRNEMTKLWRRPVLYIMAIILVLLSTGISLLLKEADRFQAVEPRPLESVEAEIAAERDTYQSMLEQAEADLEAHEPEADPASPTLQAAYQRYGKARAELHRLDWIESHKDLYSQMGSAYDFLVPYTEMKAAQFTFERKPAAARSIRETAAYSVLKSSISRYEARFERGTLADILDILHDLQRLSGQDDAVSEKVFALESEMAASGVSAQNIFALSAGYRDALLRLAGMETGGDKNTVYLPSERKTLEHEVLMYEYRGTGRADNPIGDTAANFYYYILISFAAFVGGILVIIVAGSQISSERSSGSIKSLILSPVRRWKIVTAKLSASFTVLLLFTLITWLVCTLSLQLIVGYPLQPYLYVSNGQVAEMPGWIYGLATAFLQNIGSLFFLLFAFMLSAAGLSTAAAVGISMGIRFGAQPLVFLLYQILPEAVWMRFLPFQHFDLQHHILPLGTSDLGTFGGIGTSAGPPTSLSFSLIWLVSLSLIMLIAAYDSFTRKDL